VVSPREWGSSIPMGLDLTVTLWVEDLTILCCNNNNMIIIITYYLTILLTYAVPESGSLLSLVCSNSSLGWGFVWNCPSQGEKCDNSFMETCQNLYVCPNLLPLGSATITTGPHWRRGIAGRLTLLIRNGLFYFWVEGIKDFVLINFLGN